MVVAKRACMIVVSWCFVLFCVLFALFSLCFICAFCFVNAQKNVGVVGVDVPRAMVVAERSCWVGERCCYFVFLLMCTRYTK